MPPPIFQVTKGALRLELARAFGDLIASSGSLNAPSTNGLLSPVLVFGHANDIIGGEVSFRSGGGASIADGARIVTSASPYATDGSLGEIRVRQAWAVAPSTNSAWEIHRLFTRAQYDDALTRALRRVARRALLSVDEYLVGSSWIRNPTFSTWLNGDASAPEYWVLNGTDASITRETETVWAGHNIAVVRNGASEAVYLAGSVIDSAKFAGQTVTIRVMCATTSGGRARVTLQGSVGGAEQSSSFHPGISGDDGAGLWRELTIENFTIPTTGQSFTIQLRTETGDALNVAWGKVLVDNGTLWEYDLSSRFAYIQDVFVSSEEGRWDKLPQEWWFISRGFRESAITGDDSGRSRLGFLRNFYSPKSNDLIRVVGQEYPTDPGEEGNLPVDPEYVFNRSAADLFMLLPKGSADWKNWQRSADIWELKALEIERRIKTRPYQGSRTVEDM